jgi:hypothetical protein
VQPFQAGPGDSCGVLALIGVAGEKAPEELFDFLTGCRLILRHADSRPLARGSFHRLPGLGEAAQWQIALPEAGPLHAELRLPGVARVRYALTTLPDRLTVLVAVAEADGSIEVQQWLLPLPGRSAPPEPVQGLRGFRRLELALSFYAAGDSDAALAVLGRDLEELLAGTSPDPILGCVAGYAQVRTGGTERFARQALPSLLEAFPSLPDLHVLAGLCEPDEGRRAAHFETALRRGVPLFAEGTRILAERLHPVPAPLAEPRASLLAGSPWTAWAPVQPVLLVRAGNFETPPLSWSVLEENRPAVEASLLSIGRLEVEGHPQLTWFGTGFLVAPDLVMAASFSIDQLLENPPRSEGKNDQIFRGLVLRPDFRLRVDFREEQGQSEGPAEFDVIEVVCAHPLSRIALLRVARVSRDGALALPAPLKLASGEPGGKLNGRPVYTAGYPARDMRLDQKVLDTALAGTYDVKRLQPGEILDLSPDGRTVRHDCFTSGGNAGAPLIDLASGAVIGLHHSGKGMLHKEATALWRLAGHDLFAGTGVEWVPW